MHKKKIYDKFTKFVKITKSVQLKKIAITKFSKCVLVSISANSVRCLGGHTEEVVEKNPRAYLFLNVIIIFLAELVASGVVIIV